MEQGIFYILAAVVVIATFFSVREKHPVHAIIYLATSFFALAVIFYLLAAPLVAAFEVIIYAGAIMVLFLFVIMMLDLGRPEKAMLPGKRDRGIALLLSAVTLAAVITLAVHRSVSMPAAPPMRIHDFAAFLFSRYGFAVEVVSMQLLFALVGALYLGRRR
ncbi:MAG TPA: NADH-quinone oxidoreductase subunit J [Geobacteraceae bacterium]|nr:NADH-quinone oxidoreductase subunit J [Geobacteraceae bacterium]